MGSGAPDLPGGHRRVERHGEVVHRGTTVPQPVPERLPVGTRALALYAWGAFVTTLVLLDAEDGGTGSAPLRSCHADRPAVGHSVDYVPLRIVCETRDGATYTSDETQGYVNAGVAVLALTAVASAVTSRYANEVRARAEACR
ncbi:hypothetical protein H8R17_18900 [Streptomyces sp. TRM68367]|nr:hypothetical protein [Streptomyces sp. TRM68367]MBC9726871.1 hypothetical protein [Streptomyces sp. TRM68367]